MVVWKDGGQAENGVLASVQVQIQEGLCMLECRGQEADYGTGSESTEHGVPVRQFHLFLMGAENPLKGLICIQSVVQVD